MNDRYLEDGTKDFDYAGCQYETIVLKYNRRESVVSINLPSVTVERVKHRT